jgi:formate C-acetyltransferase
MGNWLRECDIQGWRRHGRREAGVGGRCGRGFEEGRWQRAIDVRDFVIRNVTSYIGDKSFLVGTFARTFAVWAKLQPYFQEEQRKGVLDVDATTPSTMLAHAPGWIVPIR